MAPSSTKETIDRLIERHAPSRKVSPWSEWECDAWRPPPQIGIDEWSEKTIFLPRSIADTPGQLSWDTFKPAREILRAANDPEVEEITMCFPAQTAKTLICQCVLLYFLVEEGLPCLHVLGREADAVSLNEDRYQRIIEESPKLRALLTGAAHDMTRDAIRINGSTLFFRSANSPAGLAMHSIAKLVTDETDKYEEFSGREADPISLARERTERRSDRLIIKASTPTTPRGYIWLEYQNGDQRSYWVPCPRCNYFQLMVLGTMDPTAPGIKIPPGIRDPEVIVRDRLAWYECEGCRGKLLDIDKPALLRDGLWVPAKHRINQKTGKVAGDPLPRRHLSYHITRAYAPWANSTFSHVIAEFLRSCPYPSKLMNFRNSWLAEVWEDLVDKVEGQHIRDRVLNYKQGEVPPEAHMLTAGVDIQLGHIWFAIRAWGAHGESWLVRCGRLGSGSVSDFYALEEALFQSHYFAIGTQDPVPLELVFVDVGFAARKDEALQFCERNSCQPIRGAANPTSIASDTNVTDSTGRVHPLRLIDTGHFKSKLHRLIRLAPDDPGSWHIPSDLEEWYFQHMVAEQRKLVTDKKSGRTRHVWTVHPKGAAQHIFDAEVYALAAAVERQVEFRFKAPPQRAGWTPDPPLAPPEDGPSVVPTPPSKPPPTPKPPQRKRLTRTVCRLFS